MREAANDSIPMKRLFLTAAMLLAAMQAAAHDFWIEPSSHRPQPGDTVRIRLLVGEKLHGEPVARPAPGGFRQFVVHAGGEARPVPGRAGADPAGLVRIAAGESAAPIVVYQSVRIPIEIDAPTFTRYLKEEGLDAIVEQRAARGDAGKPGREIYARNAKSLLAVGEPQETGDRVIGLPLELVAERNPYRMQPGDALTVRLLYRGRPLPGVLVVAQGRARPDAPVSVRSDADGRATLKLAEPGFWLVKAVHMVPSSEPAAADWDSEWASLTFELPAPRRP